MFYQSYLHFVKKTKIVLFPNLLQKDDQRYITEWIQYSKSFSDRYKKELPFLKSQTHLVEEAALNKQWDSVHDLVLQSRKQILHLVKDRGYNTQTIMMEDLLSLVLEMEQSISDNDFSKLMEQYNDFNSKFTFVIPVIIKSDAVQIGNLADLLYKQVLFQNEENLRTTYLQFKSFFINGYRDYLVK